MNYLKLKELIVPTYDGTSDKLTADALNASLSSTRETRLTNLQVIKLLGMSDAKLLFDTLELAAQGNSVVKFSIKDMGTVGIDVNDVNTKAMLGSFIGNGISQSINDKLINAANYTTTIAEQNGFQLVSESDIKFARTGSY